MADDALDSLIGTLPPAIPSRAPAEHDPLDDIINSVPPAATGMGAPSPISATERWKYLAPPVTAPAPDLQSRFLQLADKNPTIPGMEKLGGVAPPVPGPPEPPAPIETSLQSKPLFTPEETGLATPALNMMGQGLGNAMSGVEAMTRPTMKEKAGGAHQAFQGAMALATPLIAGAAGAAPLRTLGTVAAFSGAQKGTEEGLKALGLAPEYSAVVGDLVGFLAGAAAHRLAAPEMAQLKSTLMHRMADKVASEPPPEPVAPEPPPPSKTQTVSPATPNPPTAALPTVPESPETMAIQIQQLVAGQRRVVMFPKGTMPPDNAPPGNIGITSDKFKNVYWLRTDMIEPGEIHRAAEKNELPQILGGPEGLGAPDKSQATGPVVVAKAPNGTEVQATATTPEQLPQTVAAHQQVTPLGGKVEVETPESVIRERASQAFHGDRVEPESESSGELFRGDWNVQPNERGLQQQAEAAQATAGKVDRITGGTKDRHAMMMQAVSETNPQAGTVGGNRDFDPMHMGQFEGEPVKPNIAAVNDRIVNHWDEPIPGIGKYSGSPGEVPQAWYSRLINGVSREMAQWRPGQRILIVTSGRDIQAVRAWAAAGFKGDPDFNVLTQDWATKPGELLHLDPATGKLTDVAEPQPGINFLRHGETDANAPPLGEATASSKPPITAQADRPAPPQPAVGTPEPIRASAQPQAPPPAMGEPEPMREGPVSQFLTSEEGAFKPQDFLKEPIELHGLRGLMQRALAVRNPSEQQAKLGKYSRQYYVGNRDWWITKINQQLDTIAKLPEVEQRALSIYREFRQRRGELVQMLANSHPIYKNIDDIKPEIRLALKPTPEMVTADGLLTQIATVHLAEAKRLGIFKKSSIKPDEYVPHDIIPQYYKNDVEQMSPATGGNMKRTFSHAKARNVWDTFVDAVNEGALPRTMNARDAFTVYSKEFATSRATAMWEDWIKGLGFGEWKIGKPERIGPTSAAIDLTPFAGQSNRFAHQIAVPGATGATATDPPEVVNMKFWVPKFIDKAMEPVTAKDITQDVPVFKSFQEYQQFVKGVDLALSAFHPKALFMMVVSDMRKPSDAVAWANLDMNSPWARTKEMDGALFGTGTDILQRNMDALQRMEPGKMPSWPDIIKKTPGIKQLNEFAEYNTKFIFGVMQRKMKVWTYGTMVDRWMAQHPNFTPEEMVEAKTSIARFVNTKFGGLNWEMMGWHKSTLSIARFFMLAPDWFMSNIESGKMAFTKGAGGTAARRFWVQGLLMAGAATQLMSIAFTGHPSTHFTEVDEGGKYRNWFFTGAPGELVNVTNAIARQGFTGGLAKWGLGKGNVLPRVAIQSATGETYSGKKINAPDLSPVAKTIRTTAYAARSAAPVPFSIQNIIDSWTKGTGGKELAKEVVAMIFSGRPAYQEKEKKEFPKPETSLMQQILTGKATMSDKAPAGAERTKVLRDIKSGNASAEEVKEALERKLVTEKDRRTAEKSAKLTPLQRQVKNASAQAAVRIYDQAQPEQRKEIERLVKDKVYRARTHGADWTDQGAALAKKHFGVDVERLRAPAPIR